MLQVISPASGAVHKACTVLSAAVKGVLSLELPQTLWDRPCSHCTHMRRNVTIGAGRIGIGALKVSRKSSAHLIRYDSAAKHVILAGDQLPN